MRVPILLAWTFVAACSQSPGASGGGLPSLTSSGSASSGATASSSHSGSSGHHSTTSSENSGTSGSGNSGDSSSTGVIPDAGPPVAVTGTIQGKSVSAANVLSFLSNGDFLAIEATDDDNFTCELAALTAGGVSFADVSSLSVTVVGNATLTPGVYAIGADAGTVAIAATYAQNDATCTPSDVVATSGSVTIAAISETSATGTFTFDFGTNGSLSGSFNAPFCVLSAGDGGGPADAGSCRPRP